MDGFFKVVRTILYSISVGAMLAMLGIIFLQVITRYFFGHTYEWSEELARFLFVWVTFLGGALIMGESGHLAVQLLPSKLQGKVAGLVLDGFINLCSYVFILLLIFQGSKMVAVMTFQESPGLGLPMSWVYLVMPASGVLMMLYLFKDTVRIAKAVAGRMR